MPPSLANSQRGLLSQALHYPDADDESEDRRSEITSPRSTRCKRRNESHSPHSSPHSPPQKQRKQAFMTNGLNPDLILTPRFTQNSPTQRTQNRATRQAVNGRTAVDYDMKFHPMDLVTRPNSTRRRKGLASKEPRWRPGRSDEEDNVIDPGSDLGSSTESDHTETDGRPTKRMRSPLPHLRLPDPKAIRSSQRSAAKIHHNYRKDIHPDFDPWWQDEGKELQSINKRNAQDNGGKQRPVKSKRNALPVQYAKKSAPRRPAVILGDEYPGTKRVVKPGRVPKGIASTRYEEDKQPALEDDSSSTEGSATGTRADEPRHIEDPFDDDYDKLDAQASKHHVDDAAEGMVHQREEENSGEDTPGNHKSRRKSTTFSRDSSPEIAESVYESAQSEGEEFEDARQSTVHPALSNTNAGLLGLNIDIQQPPPTTPHATSKDTLSQYLDPSVLTRSSAKDTSKGNTHVKSAMILQGKGSSPRRMSNGTASTGTLVDDEDIVESSPNETSSIPNHIMTDSPGPKDPDAEWEESAPAFFTRGL